MHKLTPSAKRLQRNRQHATMRRRAITRARRCEESRIAYELCVKDKLGLERKMDVHHKRASDVT